MSTNLLQEQICVVGAGPAGLAAAVAAVEQGATAAVVDSAAQPGGQYWRHRPETAVPDPDGRGHHDWARYTELRRRFDDAVAVGRIRYLPGTQVWMAGRDGEGFSLQMGPTVGPGPQRRLHARRLVLCTGAYDRQLPVPGWDLPGVMAAGGVQGFIKANGTLPGRRFVVAGTGPFLLSVAANIAQAGGAVAAVCEAASLSGWVPHLGAAAAVPEKAVEGAEYASVFARHRIPYRLRTVVTEILGTDRVEAVRTAKVDAAGRIRSGTERLIRDVDCVGLGWGFAPQLDLPLALGAETALDADGSLICTVDERQESSVPGLYLAGEITGVGGSALAVLEGAAAGSAAAGRAEADAPKRREKYRRFARAMHLAHPVPERWEGWLTPETTVCRCEEVPWAEVRRARDELGAEDARSMKSLTRTGMGWCQGRICGFAVSCLTGDGGNQPGAESLASVAKRQFAGPVTVGALADIEPFQDTPHERTDPA